MSHSTLRSLDSLLDDVDVIEIPVIQRDYAQGRAEAVDIRDAFLAAIERALLPEGAPLNLDFVYGSVEGKSVRSLSVLDGQQRLTTLFLLHWCVAAIDGQLPLFRARWSKSNDRCSFRYATRPGAEAFFHALTSKDFDVHAAATQPLSRRLVDSKWFIAAWQRDPTVSSALVMLDSIHQRFGEQRGLYERLTTGQPITFHFLELRNFGLQADELYIKMNARGKPLTPFENLKAWLVDRVARQPWAEAFALKLDQQWVDYFWSLAGRQKSAGFDGLFLRFFYLCAYFERVRKIENIWTLRRPKETEAWLTELRSEPFVALKSFDDNEALQPQELAQVAGDLDFLTSNTYSDHAGVVHAALQPRASYDALLRLYARVAFARAASFAPDKHDGEAFRRWIRVTENLIVNSRIDDLSAAAGAIRGLSSMAVHARNLYEALANGKLSAIGFAKDQVDEESVKASLILADPTWEPLLQEAESHWYLQGRVRSVINLSARGSDAPQQSAFTTALAAITLVVTPAVLTSRDFPLQRALLATYDFLPEATSGNHTFCVPRATTSRDRIENWLPVIEDPRFAQILDRVEGGALSSLNALIEASQATGWRRCLVEEPRLLGYCSKNLVRKQGVDLLLLSKSRLFGYYAEARGYALYLALVRRRDTGQLHGLTHLDYVFVYGTEVSPRLEFRLEGKFQVWFAAGRWVCRKDGQEHPLPDPIATKVEAYT